MSGDCCGARPATLGDRVDVNWRELAHDYDRVRDLIEESIPGFEDYNRRVREPSGFALPNGPRQRVLTPSKKAHFTVHPIPRIALGKNQYDGNRPQS